MKLLKLLGNMINEDVKGLDVRMFALFAEVFDKLLDALKEDKMDEVYDELSEYYTGNKRLSLDYFYKFLKLNKDHFIKDKEPIKEEEYKKNFLHKYWDEKGFDAKPIYHYLGLNPRNKEDKKEIFYHKLSYLGGIENIVKGFEEKVLTGRPVIIESGGYEIEYLVTGVDIDMFEPDSQMDMTHDGEIFYEMTGLINGDTSEVTILTNGETYNIGDLSRGDVDLNDSVVEEIGYELSDVIRDYFDNIGSLFSVNGDMIDYQVVSDEKFKSSINPLTK
jgi:hypothetical protein